MFRPGQRQRKGAELNPDVPGSVRNQHCCDAQRFVLSGETVRDRTTH